jgi:excisionase family DNA binding protein
MAPRLLTTQEAAEFLRVSRATIRRWCKARELPAVQIGRQWRIDMDQLERVLAGEALLGDRPEPEG